jgi:hypothetical protein
MMNPEIKARWVAWLRANADKQARGRLQRITATNNDNGIGFCCLGGLCEIAVADGIIGRKIIDPRNIDPWVEHGSQLVVSYGANRDWNANSLPEDVVNWAGLHSMDPALVVAGERHPLTNINDILRLNFRQIADLIEQQL